MSIKPKLTKLWVAVALLLVAGMAQADAVSVAVAANFTEPMKKITAEFEKSTDHKVALSFGSTGKFYAQVKAGAPFEVLLAADDETPGRMEQEGLAVKDSHFAYAIGKLVLWSAKEAVVDGNGNILKRGSFDHIAVANPKLAPYGEAGMQTLQALGVHDAIAPKIVQGENIAQTYQFIVTGNALLGFVALSQVIGEDGKVKSGSAWIVPEKYYTQIRQDAVLLEKGKNKTAAVELLKFLKTPYAARIIQSYGYGLPQ